MVRDAQDVEKQITSKKSAEAKMGRHLEMSKEEGLFKTMRQ